MVILSAAKNLVFQEVEIIHFVPEDSKTSFARASIE
jgi:hypothetical protein